MLAKVQIAAVLGIDAYIVKVELDVSEGLPSFNTHAIFALFSPRTRSLCLERDALHLTVMKNHGISFIAVMIGILMEFKVLSEYGFIINHWNKKNAKKTVS